MRSSVHPVAVAVAVSALVAACGGATGPSATNAPAAAASSAAPDARTAQLADLYQRAKGEGTIAFYSALPAQSVEDQYIAPFKRAYPGINVENVAVGTGAAVLQAFKTETTSGVYKADILYLSTPDAAALAKDGFLAKYESLNATDIKGAGLRDQQGYWYGVNVRLVGPNVNTQKLAKDLWPADWLDFAKPRPEWNGKIGMLDPKAVGLQYNWLFAMEDKFGAAKLDEIMNGLKSAAVKFYANNGALTAALESGEISIALANGDPFTVPSINKGAPVSWIIPSSGMVRYPVPMLISAKAPHPSAARLWLEFVLSREGQTAMAKGAAFPVLEGVPVGPGYPSASAFITVDEIKAVDSKTAILARFSAIFGR